jgi:hypothetical protein
MDKKWPAILFKKRPSRYTANLKKGVSAVDR